MNLKQLYDLADSGSYYSHTEKTDDIWSALTESARRLYLWVVKENRGYFIKWDTTTIAIVPGTDEYRCPMDLANILRFSERSDPSGRYRPMTPTRVESSLFIANQFEDLLSPVDGPFSDFSYIGPYLGAAQSQQQTGDQPPGPYSVRLAPTPQDPRETELVYSAKFLEMWKESDINVIPPEGHGAMLDYAIAHLLQANDDDNAANYTASGNQKRAEFLTFIRDRQWQQYETQEPYLQDLD